MIWRTHLLWLLLVVTSVTGCGPDETGVGTVAANLSIPRALADELESIDIYLYETQDVTGEPTDVQLLTADAMGNYDTYKSYNERKMVTLAFQTSQSATIDGIPDKGSVWRFYARGYDSNPLLIAHGATQGRIAISTDKDNPTSLTIDLRRIPE